MDTQTVEPVSPPRHRHGTIALIVLLIVLWCLAMVFRNSIRAYWWSRRLTTVAPAQRHDYVVRLAAVGQAAIPAMGRIMNDPRPDVRRIALRLLDRLDSKAAAERLVRMTDDPDDDIAITAGVMAADHTGADAVRDRYLPALKTDDRPARLAAAVLGHIGDRQAEDALMKALKSGRDANVLAEIIDALVIMRSRRAIPLIEPLIEDDRPVTILPYSYRCAVAGLQAIQAGPAQPDVDTAALLDAMRAETTLGTVARRAVRLLSAPVASQPAGPLQ